MVHYIISLLETLPEESGLLNSHISGVLRVVSGVDQGGLDQGFPGKLTGAQ